MARIATPASVKGAKMTEKHDVVFRVDTPKPVQTVFQRVKRDRVVIIPTTTLEQQTFVSAVRLALGTKNPAIQIFQSEDGETTFIVKRSEMLTMEHAEMFPPVPPVAPLSTDPPVIYQG